MRPLLRTFGWMMVAVVIASSAEALPVPVGTGFTYQGQLKQNGSLVTGSKHLRFSLWDAAGTGTPPVGGTQVGASQLLTNVTVTNGLFTVLLNEGQEFGYFAFNNDARWLQIEICEDPGCATLTILSPRLAIKPTPFSLHSAGPWRFSDANIVFMGGNVGIGGAPPPFPPRHGRRVGIRTL